MFNTTHTAESNAMKMFKLKQPAEGHVIEQELHDLMEDDVFRLKQLMVGTNYDCKFSLEAGGIAVFGLKDELQFLTECDWIAEKGDLVLRFGSARQGTILLVKQAGIASFVAEAE